MSIARFSRDRKRQLGQYYTPPDVAAAIVRSLDITRDLRILEPSFGTGVFIFEILAAAKPCLSQGETRSWCEKHLFGCELDASAYLSFRSAWQAKGLGEVPLTLEQCDFFRWMPPGLDRRVATHRKAYFVSRQEYFDLIVGNPPFGGSIDPAIQDDLDAILGSRDGYKIKKETYAFFLIKALDLLKPGGRLVFICSDSILTIPTMTGLRRWLEKNCDIEVSHVPGDFPETRQDMLLLNLRKCPAPPDDLKVFGRKIPRAIISTTPNLSWQIDSRFAHYFTGVSVGSKMVATSGMTIGSNSLFLREIDENGFIEEPYEMSLAKRNITVSEEIARARLGKVSERRLGRIRAAEADGATEEIVEFKMLKEPRRIRLPHEDYKLYNKAVSQIVYSKPRWVIFWRQNGQYVYTFKKTGSWYLHGVGGMKYFQREGITWPLIAGRLYARYLPPGYILDSGAPCAFLRPGVDHDELFFILGWALTDVCSDIVKQVLNHTRNIQSKDFERLPYPTWVDVETRARIICHVKGIVRRAEAGEVYSFASESIRQLNHMFLWQECCASGSPGNDRAKPDMDSLFDYGNPEQHGDALRDSSVPVNRSSG